MNEINIYQIDDVITKALGPLLLKVLEDKKKAMIFCPNAAKLKEIDDSLWSYGKNKFIPHLSPADKALGEEFGWDRQPILINAKEENLNNADHLVLIDEASEAFISRFKRVFYFYDAQNSTAVKKFAKKFAKMNSYKKVDGKWVKEG